MISPNAAIRKALIAKMNGQIILNGSALPIYNHVPSTATFPYIFITTIGDDEAFQNQQSFILNTVTRIEVVTRFKSDAGGDLDCDLAISQILSKVRTRDEDYIDLTADGFNVISQVSNGTTNFQEDDKDYTYFRRILELAITTQEI